jgi:hypothetical protein
MVNAPGSLELDAPSGRLHRRARHRRVRPSDGARTRYSRRRGSAECPAVLDELRGMPSVVGKSGFRRLGRRNWLFTWLDDGGNPFMARTMVAIRSSPSCELSSARGTSSRRYSRSAATSASRSSGDWNARRYRPRRPATSRNAPLTKRTLSLPRPDVDPGPRRGRLGDSPASSPGLTSTAAGRG